MRQTNFDRIAHKIDKMGDYKPEIVYENAGIQELDPRDETAFARIHQSSTAMFVTVRDDVDLPVIAAFRLLAARLQPRHPILLKDAFCHSERSRGIPSRYRTATQRDPSTSLRSAQDDSGHFLETLLTASTNIGSLLCDGIGDAILVQGEEAPGKRSACPTIFYKRLDHEFSKRITSRVPPADGHCSTCKRPRPKSKRQRCT